MDDHFEQYVKPSASRALVFDPGSLHGTRYPNPPLSYTHYCPHLAHSNPYTSTPSPHTSRGHRHHCCW